MSSRLVVAITICISKPHHCAQFFGEHSSYANQLFSFPRPGSHSLSLTPLTTPLENVGLTKVHPARRTDSRGR